MEIFFIRCPFKHFTCNSSVNIHGKCCKVDTIISLFFFSGLGKQGMGRLKKSSKVTNIGRTRDKFPIQEAGFKSYV